MTEPSRWSVPLEQLARVPETATAHDEPALPGSSDWSGPQLPPYLDGGGGDGD